MFYELQLAVIIFSLNGSETKEVFSNLPYLTTSRTLHGLSRFKVSSSAIFLPVDTILTLFVMKNYNHSAHIYGLENLLLVSIHTFLHIFFEKKKDVWVDKLFFLLRALNSRLLNPSCAFQSPYFT